MSNQAYTSRQHAAKGFALALLAVVLWSGNFVVARALHQSVSPVALAFFRWLIATVVLFPFAWRTLRAEWPRLLPHTLYLGLTALAGVTIFNTLVYVAARSTSATNMALIGTTASPVFVFLISAVFLRQKLTLQQYAGMAFCLFGIVALLSGGEWKQLRHFRFSTGDLWILAAALSFAVYTLLVRQKPPGLSSLSFLTAVFFLGTLFLLPVYWLDSMSSAGIAWSGTLFFALLYLGVCASVIAFLSWNISIRQLGAPRTALFGNLIPVFSTVEAAWLLNEKITALTIGSFLLILAGILLANWQVLKAFVRR